jgi:hypothetical protein
MEEISRFGVNVQLIPLYLDTAQTYMGLSSGALALTIAFREKVIGASPGTRVSSLLVTSWFVYLVTIGASALYQYFAVKFLDSISPHPGRIRYFEDLVRSPGLIYGVMVVCFFVASALLILAAWRDLRATRRQTPDQ